MRTDRFNGVDLLVKLRYHLLFLSLPLGLVIFSESFQSRELNLTPIQFICIEYVKKLVTCGKVLTCSNCNLLFQV